MNSQDAAFERGLICRALGSAIALSPPLIISESDIDEIGSILRAAIDEVASQLQAS